MVRKDVYVNNLNQIIILNSINQHILGWEFRSVIKQKIENKNYEIDIFNNEYKAIIKPKTLRPIVELIKMMYFYYLTGKHGEKYENIINPSR